MTRPFSDLIDLKEPAWPLVQEWLRSARNDVEVLPADRAAGERALAGLQVGGLLAWNGLDATRWPDPRLRDAIVVAHDAIGGFFAINGGAYAAGDLGRVFYFAPDPLRWEDLGMGYSEFVQWALGGDLAAFYLASRWPAWREEIAEASGDQGFSTYPPLFAAGAPTGDRSRQLVPMTELWTLLWHYSNQAGGLPDGATFTINVSD